MLSMLSPLTPFDLLDAAMSEVRMPANPLPGCRFDTTQPRLQDTPTSYALHVNAPGVQPSDLVINAIDGRLTVKGETSSAQHTHFVNYTVALPHDVDVDAASATSADGLVVVTLPKRAAVEPARIAVSNVAEEEEERELNGEAIEDDDDEARSTLSDKERRPYKITLVAAGLAPADALVHVEEHTGVLTVRGTTKRTGARIARRFAMPRDADLTCARASHVDGILTITVPKKAKPAPTLIAVNREAPLAAGGDQMDTDLDKEEVGASATATDAGAEDEEGVMV